MNSKDGVISGAFRRVEASVDPDGQQSADRSADWLAAAGSAPQQRLNGRRLAELCRWAGRAHPADLTAGDVEAWLDWRGTPVADGGGGDSPKTIRNKLSSISAACRRLKRAGLVAANPCVEIPRPRLEELPPVALARPQLRAALRVARRIGLDVELAVAFGTGCRVSELARLRWADVDLPGRRLIVRKSKSGKWRLLSLCRLTRAALARQRRIVPAEISYVFPSRHTFRGGWRCRDGPRCRAWWQRHFQPIQDAVPAFLTLGKGSPSTKWHVLRHTAATDLAAEGFGELDLAAFLGHSDVRMTRRYIRLAQRYNSRIEGLRL